MRLLYFFGLCASLPLFTPVALADPLDPPNLTDTVAQAMQQAAAITEATKADAAKTGDRLSQAPTQALYERYHPGGANPATPAKKPCDHPPTLEAGGLCIPASANK